MRIMKWAEREEKDRRNEIEIRAAGDREKERDLERKGGNRRKRKKRIKSDILLTWQRE